MGEFEDALEDMADEVRMEEEMAKEHNQDAYEHTLFCRRKTIPRPSTAKHIAITDDDSTCRILLFLSGPLSTPEKVQEIAHFATIPETRTAISEDNADPALICYIDIHAKQRIQDWLVANYIGFNLLFVTTWMAVKELSSVSAYPTLGVDSTLPQYRVNDSTSGPFLPRPEQYPVWYFFYGTLAEPDRLVRLLELPATASPPVLRPARIAGGVVKSWQGKYRALVDGPLDARVLGHAFEVADREQEDRLRVYETRSYEVVRCGIKMVETGGYVRGLTFRFRDAGMLRELG